MDPLDGFALLVLDDHPLFRDGLVAALRHHVPRLRACAAGTLGEAVDALDHAPGEFDLVLVDYRMPGVDGLQCAEQLMARYPGMAVGLMSGVDDQNLALCACESGLVAYLPKSLEIAALLTQLRRLAHGEPVFDLPASGVQNGTVLGLTIRQKEVLQLLSTGNSNKEIARAIGISPATVKHHLEAIFARLGVANRLQAVMMARSMFGERTG